MIKKSRLYKKFISMLYQMYIHKEENKFNNRLKYLFKRNKTSDELIVVFSGFPGDDVAKYNYVRTLSGVPCNQLFILDDFGWQKKGSYYLGENGDFYVEKMVLELIQMLKDQYKINRLITAGSSKGGGVCYLLRSEIAG